MLWGKNRGKWKGRQPLGVKPSTSLAWALGLTLTPGSCRLFAFLCFCLITSESKPHERRRKSLQWHWQQWQIESCKLPVNVIFKERGGILESKFDDFSFYQSEMLPMGEWLQRNTDTGLLWMTNQGNLKQPTRQDIINWVSKAWESIKKEIIVKSFLECGIANALDGTEDNCQWWCSV